jgi:membrane complex biogenesis BtpA family protein
VGLFMCKPLIGVVHLPPLPGSYGYKRRPYPFAHGHRFSIEEIIEYAIGEARKYYEAGFDAVLVENFGDKPYKLEVGHAETIALTVVTREIVKSVPIPVGVNVLRNSPHLALQIAHAAGAKFVRANSLCEIRYSVEGIIMPRMHDVARTIMELDLMDDLLEGRLEILADIDAKHTRPAGGQVNLNILIKDCTERCGFPISSIVATGSSTGEAPSISYVESLYEIAKNNGLRLTIGSGIRIDNLAEFWRVADGFIVGTSVKLGEKTENTVSIEKAMRLANLVKRYRNVWPCHTERT